MKAQTILRSLMRAAVAAVWVAATYIFASTPIVSETMQNVSFVGWIYAYPLITIFFDKHLEDTWKLWLALLIVIACTLPILVPIVTAGGVLAIGTHSRSISRSHRGEDQYGLHRDGDQCGSHN